MDHIDFRRLLKVITARFPLNIHSVHGPRHWKQVEKNGLILAKETGADETIIRLFSIFHDSRRENDQKDDGHGTRGAELAKSMRGIYFGLSDDSFDILMEACRYHTDGRPTSNLSIATCWDADRLDLPRVGIMPKPDRMGTAPGRRLARSQQKWP